MIVCVVMQKFDATLRPDQGIHYSGVCPSSLTTATLDMLELQMVGGVAWKLGGYNPPGGVWINHWYRNGPLSKNYVPKLYVPKSVLCRYGSTPASELILEWGRRGEARRAESGGWGSWEGTASPSPPTRGLQERCKLPQRAPAAEGFSCILSRQIAFPSISVRVAYSLHG